MTLAHELHRHWPMLARGADAYLCELSTMTSAERQRLEADGQTAWSRTGLAARQRSSLASFVAEILGNGDALGFDTLIDVGCGDGQATEALTRPLPGQTSRLRRIVLVDRNPSVLSLAERRLRSIEQANVDLVTRCADIRELGIRDDASPGCLVLAAASLHELDRSDKARVLRAIAACGAKLLLMELEADHDSKPPNGTVLFERAAWFYNSLIADAYESLPEDDHRIVIGAFLLGEFLDLVRQPYTLRRNYHLDLGGWQRTLATSGFSIVATRSIDQLQNGPATCIMYAVGSN